MGLYTMIADNLATPFQTEVLGVEVTVGDIDLTERNTIVAHCSRGGFEQMINLLDLPLPTPPPDGAEWIEAYRHSDPLTCASRTLSHPTVGGPTPANATSSPTHTSRWPASSD